MADKYFAGKSGHVFVGSSLGNEVAVKSWKATHEIAEIDTTSTTSNGHAEVQGGIDKIAGSFEAEWNASTSPFSAGYGFTAGTYLDLELDIDSSRAEKILIPSAFVKSVDIDLGVDAVVKYTLAFQSNGSFTMPS